MAASGGVKAHTSGARASAEGAVQGAFVWARELTRLIEGEAEELGIDLGGRWRGIKNPTLLWKGATALSEGASQGSAQTV